MKINYKLMNDILDGFYVWGLPFIFLITGYYIINALYRIVSIGYVCFIIWCHVQRYCDEKAKKEVDKNRDDEKEIATATL